MRGAQGIAAHLLQDLHLALGGADVEGCAERAEVVVVVGTLDPHGLPIDEDALVGIVGDGADAEGGLVRIDYGPGDGEGRDGDVHVGLLDWCGTPELRVGDGYGAGGG